MSDNLTVSSGTITTSNAGDFPYAFPIPNFYYDESSPNIEDWRYVQCPSIWYEPNIKEGGENMRYLYEVILVNPKDDEFEIFELVARSETAALMYAYEDSDFSGNDDEKDNVCFDDLKVQCRILMSWKKVGE